MRLFDLHCDTIWKVFHEDSQLSKNDYHIDMNKMKIGGSLAQFFAMYVDLNETSHAFKTCNDMIDRFEEEINLNKSTIKAGKTIRDIHENWDGVTGIITIEEGGVLEGYLDNLDHFYGRGVRSLTLTWNYENEIGYPNCDKAFQKKGLKPFGIEVVKRMNDLGMIVDVSHLSDGGFWDCIKYSSQPIIASHSNARSIHNSCRNLTDDMILALRDKGGLMGINFYSGFLGASDISRVEDMVKHIKHIYDLAGIDVIAIGSDFDGIEGQLEIKDMSKINLLAEALIHEGFTQDQVEKIFYRNALRLLGAISEHTD